MSSTPNNSLDSINLIRDITLHYVKYYYEKYLEEHNIKLIPDAELIALVSRLYNEKQKDLKDYIRKNMRENLEAKYNSIIVENALEEMFSDKDFAIQRVVIEILNYQAQ